MFTHIPDITSKRAELAPNGVALRDLVRGTLLTYAQLDDNACRTAGLLVARGLSAGARIAVLCRNRLEFFELLFACGKLGAVLVPLNWRMPANELFPLIEDAQPALLFFGQEDASLAAELGTQLPTIGFDSAGDEGYPSLRDGATPHSGRPLWPASDTWYLLYTSGTTGKPKAVIQTFGMTFANYVNIRQAMSISGNDVTVNYLPLFHTAGINLVTVPTLIEGGEVLVMPGFDMPRVIDLLSTGALDTFFGVPAIYQQISLDPSFDTWTSASSVAGAAAARRCRTISLGAI